MKNLFKVMCLVLLSMSIMTSCENEEFDFEVEDSSAAIEESLNQVGEASLDESSSKGGFTTYYLQWYGDQNLANSSYTSTGVHNTVSAAVQAIVDQTNLNSKGVYGYWNQWASSGTTKSTLIESARQELGNGTRSCGKLGITYNRCTDGNGNSYYTLFVAFVDTKPNSWLVVNWPDKSAYMHEICHLLGTDDHGGLTECVTNYAYAANGSTKLCSTCKDKINTFIAQ